jgi:16S rRNA (cytidine1402-2'-O)-methyltransferase
LCLSGLPAERFLFAGFLPPKSTARREALAGLAAVPASLIFYETAPRLADSLADMADMLGSRPAAVARELTKLHEELRRGQLDELARHYAEAGPPKGEIVIVTGPPPAEGRAEPSEAELREKLAALLDRGLSRRDAAALLAAETGLPRKKLYALSLEAGR